MVCTRFNWWAVGKEGSLELMVIRIAGSHLVVPLAVPPILGRRGVVKSVFQMCCFLQLYQYHLYTLCRLVYYTNFWTIGEALLPIGLCIIWLRVTIFSIDALLHHYLSLNNVTIRLLQLIILLTRRRWMSY